MTAKEFFKIEDPGNNPKYEGDPEGWLYSKEDMVRFAEAYHQAKLKEGKIVVEFSDEWMKAVTEDELEKMREDAIEHDGFEGFMVKGRLVK